MSMDVSIACVTEATSGVVADIVDSGMCRGMLVGSPQGSTRVGAASPDTVHGGDNTTGGGLSRRRAYGSDEGDAGTSHTRGARVWDGGVAEGDYDSESD